ncbi:MAG: phosphate/phosphite/phosphonate ABC transporter substrate-binding protein [Chloroflexales bacterium]
MFRKLMPVTWTLVLTTILTACGGASAAKAPTTAPAATAAATTAPVTTVAATVAASAGPIAADRTGWPTTFRLGLFANDDSKATLQLYDAFRKQLEDRLGLPVEITTGTSYSAVVEAMRAGQVEGMEVGPFAYVLAVQEANAEAIAVVITPGTSKSDVVYDPKAPTAYFSTIITKKGSGIATLADLKGKSFAFVDPASTSGHLSPKTLLVKSGLNPDTELKATFAGSHPTAVLAVWNGSTQAGATFEGNLYTLASQGQIEFCGFPDGAIGKPRSPAEIKAVYDSCPDGKIAIIAYSDPIPNTPFAVNKNLPESFKTALRSVLQEVKDNPEIVKGLKQWYVDPTKDMGLTQLDAYYDSLRDIAKLLNLDLKKLAK